jgi:pyruvate,orthophosphate dikinase
MGLAASAGAAIGEIVFTNEDAESYFKEGKKCILCRHETSADDIGGLKVRDTIFRIDFCMDWS